jgi:cytochrome c-type biogenesis protein CcmH
MNQFEIRHRKGQNMHIAVSLLLALSSIPLTAGQSAKINKLENKFMAPCCYTQTIHDHNSQEAEQMREEVTFMVASGKSEQEIVSYYKAKYGETILVVPDGIAGTLTYLIPIAVFALSSGLLLFVIRRSIRTKAVAMETIPSLASEAEWQTIRNKIRAETGEGS